MKKKSKRRETLTNPLAQLLKIRNEDFAEDEAPSISINTRITDRIKELNKHSLTDERIIQIVNAITYAFTKNLSEIGIQLLIAFNRKLNEKGHIHPLIKNLISLDPSASTTIINASGIKPHEILSYLLSTDSILTHTGFDNDTINQLIDQGGDPILALNNAIRYKYLDHIPLLIKKVKERKGQFDKAIDVAIRHNLKAIPTLLEAGIKVQDCLYSAITYNPAAIPMLIQAGAQINLINSTLNTSPLLYACLHGKKLAVQKLLYCGADINIRSPNPLDPATPLILSCQEGHQHVVELLLANDADIELQRTNEQTALYVSISFIQLEIATLLIKKGAIPCPDITLKTPQHLAALCGAHQVMKLLLENSADPNPKDIKNKTPLEYALDKIVERTKLINLTVDQPANNGLKDVQIIKIDESHYNPIETLRLLLHYGAEVNQVLTTGNVPLQQALIDGFTKAIPLLIKYGATVDSLSIKWIVENYQDSLHLVIQAYSQRIKLSVSNDIIAIICQHLIAKPTEFNTEREFILLVQICSQEFEAQNRQNKQSNLLVQQRKEISNLKERLEHEKTLRTNDHKQTKSLSTKFNHYKDKIKAQIADFKYQHEQHVDQLQAQIADLASQLATSKSYEQKTHPLEAQIVALESQHKQHVDQLQAQIADLASQLTTSKSYEQKTHLLEAQIVALKSQHKQQVNQLQAEITELKSQHKQQVKQLQAEITELKSQHKQQVKQLQAESDERKFQLETSQGFYQKIDQRTTLTENKLKYVKIYLTQFTADLERLKEEKALLNTTIARLNTIIDQQENTKESLQTSLAKSHEPHVNPYDASINRNQFGLFPNHTNNSGLIPADQWNQTAHLKAGSFSDS